MDVKYWLLIFFLLSIANVIIFSILYTKVDKVDFSNWDDGLYLAVQIQTGIGFSDATNNQSVRHLVTAQSIITYMLDIFLVIFLGLFIAEVFSKTKISV